MSSVSGLEFPQTTDGIQLPVAPVLIGAHGHSFNSQDSNVACVRLGWGAAFRPSSPGFQWFHIAIPTPACYPGQPTYRPNLERIALLCEADNGVLVDGIHVYDGKTRIHTWDGVGLTGDNSAWRETGPHQTVFVVPGSPLIYCPVGLSVGVRFNNAAGITFFSAFAQLRYSQTAS